MLPSLTVNEFVRHLEIIHWDVSSPCRFLITVPAFSSSNRSERPLSQRLHCVCLEWQHYSHLGVL